MRTILIVTASRRLSLAVLPVFIISSFALHAAEFPEYPTLTWVYGKTGNMTAIRVDCTPVTRPQSIDCQLLQMRMRYKLNAEKFEDKYAETIAEFENMSDEETMTAFDKRCGWLTAENLQKMRDAAKTGRQQKLVSAYQELITPDCESANPEQVREAYRKYHRISLETDLRICQIIPFLWTETFELQRTTDSNYWIARSDPSGDCGVIVVSTFKKSEGFWEYETQEIVTNKEGSTPYWACSDLEETPTKFDWKITEHEVDCEVIKFGF